MGAFINALPGAIAQGLIWGIMAIGVYITFKVLNIADLTVDGSITTGGCVCTVLILGGAPAWIAVLAAFGAGIITGIITGIFHTTMGIPAILAGILTQLILWSLNLKILGQANKSISARQYSVILSSLNIGQAILVTGIIAAIIIIALYWFFGTEYGMAIRATGNNEKMSKAQGINTNVIKVFGLGLSNGIVALSGALLAQYQGFADINMGRGAIVIGLAAVIIGGAIFSKCKNFALFLLSCLVGGVAYYLVYQLVICLGIDTDFLKMLSAIVVAIFLAVPYLKKTYFSKKKPAGAKEN